MGKRLAQSGYSVLVINPFYRQAREYQRLPHDGFPLLRENLEPVLTDHKAQAGISRGHYFHQDLWAARRIFKRAPARHLDVGSRVDGFVAHVLTFMPVSVIDIRPLESDVDGLSFVRGDATRLTQASTSVESLSSLHAVEHIGLGRYGDPLDPDGWKARWDGDGIIARIESPQIARPSPT